MVLMGEPVRETEDIRHARGGGGFRQAVCAVASGVLATLSACADTSPTRVQWAEPFERLGLVPVEPPHEDLIVGDLFVYGADPEGQHGGSTRTVQARIGHVGRWSTLAVSGPLDDEYTQRPSLPPTPGWSQDRQDRPTGRPWPQPSSPAGQSIFAAGGVPGRLREIDLPSSGMAIGDQTVEALIPAEVINLTSGDHWKGQKSVVVRAGSAESYSLSLDTLLSLLVDETPGAGGRRYVLKESYRSRLPLFAEPGSGRVWIRVISEVVYIRSLDITVQSVMLDEIPNVPPPDLTAAPRPAKAAPKGDPMLRPFERASRINQLLVESGTDQLPGVTTRIVSVGDSGVTLRRILQYPVAIAARGMTLEVQSETGAVLRMGPIGTPWPRGSAPVADVSPAD